MLSLIKTNFTRIVQRPRTIGNRKCDLAQIRNRAIKHENNKLFKSFV